MEGAGRIARGGLANGLRIAGMLALQLASVPVLVAAWGPERFGFWLIAQTLVAVIALPDSGHHAYIGYACLKAPHAHRTRALIASALLAGTLSASLIVALAGLGLAFWPGRAEWLIVLALLSAHWALSASVGGVMVRASFAFGAYPRLAFWRLGITLATALVPLVVAVGGGSPVDAAVAVLVVGTVLSLLRMIDIAASWRALGIALPRPSLRSALANYRRALGLALRDGAVLARAQGVRLIIGATLGASALPQFAAIRMATQLPQHAILALGEAGEPEFLRALREGSMAGLAPMTRGFALLIIGGLCPAILMLQSAGPSVFALWTQGAIAFAPLTAAALGASVLVAAWGFPLAALLRADNAPGDQITISLIAAGVALVIAVSTAPRAGSSGVAFALFAAELASVILTARIVVPRLGTALRQRVLKPLIQAGFAVATTIAALCAFVFSALPEGVLIAMALSLLGVCVWPPLRSAGFFAAGAR